MTDTELFGTASGPTHLAQQRPHDDLAWCGVRAQFRHLRRPGAAADVTCAKCLTAIAQDRPRPRRTR